MSSSLAMDSRAVAGDVKLQEDFEGIDVELLEIDIDVLNSLLDESNCDGQYHYDNLNDVIRSLEAEIDPGSLQSPESGTIAGVVNGLVEDVSSSFDEGSRDWSEYEYTTDDFSWIDMDTVPSSPGEGMNWYMEFGNEMNCIPDYGCIIGDYPHQAQVYSTEEPAYGSLWLQTSDDMMQQ